MTFGYLHKILVSWHLVSIILTFVSSRKKRENIGVKRTKKTNVKEQRLTHQIVHFLPPHLASSKNV